MTTTPSKLKTVSFKFPSDALSPPGITASPPNKTSTHQHRPYTAPPSLSVRGHRSEDPTTAPTPVLSSKPDLVADIPEEETHVVVQDIKRPDSRPPRSDSPLTPSPTQFKVSRSRHPKSFANTTSTRDRSPYLDYGRSNKGLSPSQVAQAASKVREKTNSTSHDHIRSLKHNVSKMREHLLKVEEEIKNLNRGRSTLEMSIQDIRKALSVNQQSISTQLKKSSRGEEVCVCVCVWRCTYIQSICVCICYIVCMYKLRKCIHILYFRIPLQNYCVKKLVFSPRGNRVWSNIYRQSKLIFKD